MDNTVNHRTATQNTDSIYTLGGLDADILLLFNFLVLVYILNLQLTSGLTGTKSGTPYPLKIPSFNSIKVNTSIYYPSIS